nr:reverse transcriptase domain-containing protein [Tanacetum cinerariifolium]
MHAPVEWRLYYLCGVHQVTAKDKDILINLFPPLDNPEITIRKRSRVDPTLLNDFEMATEGNGDPPVPDLRTMKELLSGDDANKHLDKFLHVTQSIKVNGVTDDALRLYLFPHSLTHHATAWFDRLPRNSINTFEQMVKIFLGKYFPPSMVTKLRNEITNFRQRPDESLFEAWELNGVTDDALRLYLFSHSLTHHATAWFDHLSRNSINTFEQMAKMFLGKYFPPSMVTKLRNEIINFCQRPDESLFEAWERFKLSIDLCHNHNTLPVTQIDTFYIRLTLRHHDKINDTSVQRSESSSITSSFDSKIVALKAEMAEIKKNLIKPPLAKPRTYMLREPIKVVILTNLKETVICLAIVRTIISDHRGLIKIKTETIKIRTSKIKTGIKETIMELLKGTTKEETNSSKELVMTNMTSLTNSNLELKNMFGQFMKMNTASSLGLGTLPSNIVTNPKEYLKGITTQSGNAYQGPTIPTTSSPLKVVERKTEVTKDTVPPTNNKSTKDV